MRNHIETAHLSTENLHNIIDNILDINKIEAGKMEVDLELLELKPLLQEQYQLFQPDSIRKDIELILDCQVDTVYGDRLKLQQILTNLLNNAFEFTPQGSIRLRAFAKNKSLIEISVSDTGIGIEPEKQAEIFEAFIQEDGSIRRRYGGTSLGLTICKQLVELMNGKITLESEGRNCGTKVTITLPKSDRF